MDAGDIRCPSCRSVDWYRDGMTMVEDQDGVVRRLRVAPSGDDAALWSCAACAYEVPDWATLAARLTSARLSHED